MIEKLYNYSTTDSKIIEKIVDDENAVLSHVVLESGQSFPTHFSNSNVYLTILRGVLTIELDDQPVKHFNKGNIVNIPFKTKMSIQNSSNDLLEFFAFKSPNPKDMVE